MAKMENQTRYHWLSSIFWLLTGTCFGLALFRLFGWTPTERTMGPIQKIFYVHLPAAICTFLCCMVVCIAGIGYLWQRRDWWDDLAAAAARIAVLFCSFVLVTGMIWAHKIWGQWWVWTPRLTFSLILWFLYCVYLMIRASIESREKRATISAVYAIVAFLDVPLVWLSARLLPDRAELHPVSVSLAPAMKLTLQIWFVPVTLLCLGLVAEVFHFLHNQTLRRKTLSPPYGFPVIQDKTEPAPTPPPRPSGGLT